MGAVLREQNALPYEAWIMKNLTAKDDVDNVGAGRAAKGTIPVFNYIQLTLRFTALFRHFRSLQPHQNEVFMRNERINASFFYIFDKFMRAILPYFGDLNCPFHNKTFPSKKSVLV